MKYKRLFIKLLFIVAQFLFYFAINKFFDVHDRIMYNTFFIYFALNIIKNLYSFRTILIWDEIRRQIKVHCEYICVMLINDIAFWGERYIFMHLVIGVTFGAFNIIVMRIIRFIFRRWLEKRLIIVGIGRTARELTRTIKANSFLMYNIVGYISVNDMEGVKQTARVPSKMIIGKYSNIADVVQAHNVNEVIVAVPLASNKQMQDITDKLYGIVNNLKFIPEFHGTFTFNSCVENYDGLLIISSKINYIQGLSRVIKRIFDLVVGLWGTLLLAPISLGVWLATDKEERKHGIFYTQDRIGKDGKIIKIYKYRSMIKDADEKLAEILARDPAMAAEYAKNKKLRNDPRVTKIGKFLRKTSLDEFPQFLNIFRGEMSFVGPRPYLPSELKELGHHYTNIISINPGITGMWQANLRSEGDFAKRIELDEYYCRNWSLWLDTVIIIKTIRIVFNMKGAY